MSDDLLWRHLYDLPAFRALLRATEARFYAGLELPEPVLDLGCGDGHFGAVGLPRPPQVGLDPWAAPLREAGRRNVYPLLVLAGGGRMPFPDGYFGAVVSNSVLEHIPRLEPVLAETARVLRAGGLFVFAVPGDRFTAFLSIGRLLDRLGMHRLGDRYRVLFNRISRHHHCDGAEVWEERLERHGFRLLRWWPYFSSRAVAALEWGHYLGFPSLAARWLTGRGIISPSRFNLWLTERLLRPLYEEPLPREGGGLFFMAERADDKA